jgi:hypothetical protein
MNVTPYLADTTQWRVEDYWATPAEFLGSFGGDCEDYVIAKYFALKELGVPPSRLRMVYVMATIGRVQQPHMVLAYYPTPDATPLILDNDIRRTVQPVAAIAKALAYAERDPRRGDYAINVSAQTIDSGAYRQRILQALATSTGTAARIVFEMTEFGVAANVQAAIDFSAAVRHAGAHFAIDHFSVERTVLAHLPALLPRYLKLAPGLVGLTDGQFLIGTLKRMAQPLEVQLIGQGDHVLALARRERLDGYQSFEADRPHRLD